MKKANYYINLIMSVSHNKDEWLRLNDEVQAWFSSAPKVEQEEFTMSGAGELLYMMCSALA